MGGSLCADLDVIAVLLELCVALASYSTSGSAGGIMREAGLH